MKKYFIHINIDPKLQRFNGDKSKVKKIRSIKFSDEIETISEEHKKKFPQQSESKNSYSIL